MVSALYIHLLGWQIIVIWQLGDLIMVTLLAEKSDERLRDEVE